MASGHEYRTRRPNTWLLRPTPQVKILLANPEPSTHGAEGEVSGAAAARAIADIENTREKSTRTTSASVQHFPNALCKLSNHDFSGEWSYRHRRLKLYSATRDSSARSFNA
jgi:hypothetical protein